MLLWQSLCALLRTWTWTGLSTRSPLLSSPLQFMWRVSAICCSTCKVFLRVITTGTTHTHSTIYSVTALKLNVFKPLLQLQKHIHIKYFILLNKDTAKLCCSCRNSRDWLLSFLCCTNCAFPVMCLCACVSPGTWFSKPRTTWSCCSTSSTVMVGGCG